MFVCSLFLVHGLDMCPVCSGIIPISFMIYIYPFFLPSRFHVALPLFKGRGGWWFNPRPRAEGCLHLVIGTPVDTPRVEYDKNQPGGGEKFQKTVDEVHKRFLGELRKLFDKHKGKHGFGDRELEIFGGEYGEPVLETGGQTEGLGKTMGGNKSKKNECMGCDIDTSRIDTKASDTTIPFLHRSGLYRENSP